MEHVQSIPRGELSRVIARLKGLRRGERIVVVRRKTARPKFQLRDIEKFYRMRENKRREIHNHKPWEKRARNAAKNALTAIGLAPANLGEIKGSLSRSEIYER